MALTFVLDPELTPVLRDQLCALWVDVTNAGGAVGFVPPVTAADVRAELDTVCAAVNGGRSRLLVGYDAGGRAVGTAFLTYNRNPLLRHWCWLTTVMVHPSRQGEGAGRQLMAAAAEAARGMAGLRGIRLTCRGGQGLERFYGACGYREVGRVPEAIKVAEGDIRDDVILWLPLERSSEGRGSLGRQRSSAAL